MFFCIRFNVFGCQKSLARGLWWFIGFDVTRIDFYLFLELEGWAEVVGEKTPFVFVEVIDKPD